MCGGHMSVRKNVKQIIKWGILAVILTLMAFSSPLADFKFEFQSAQGYTNNIFQNTDSKDDRNTVERASIGYYPLPSLKVDLSGTYTYYGRTVGLSNFAGAVDVTFFPMKEDSPLSLYLNANYKPTIYREAFEKFENNVMSANIALGYELKKYLNLRAGFELTSTDYTNEAGTDTVESFAVYNISGDQDQYELFVGGNLTFLGANVLDVELGYASVNLSYVEMPTDSFFNPVVMDMVPRDHIIAGIDSLREGNMGSFYISPRLSRPIGSKTGINITYIYREFQDVEDMVIPGLSTQFLSPWSSVYDGHAVTATIKTFVLPNFIISSGIGYFDKKYLNSEKERVVRLGGMPPYEIDYREDEMTKFYWSIKRPIATKSNLYLEPAVQIDYSDNKSTNDFYDYNAFSMTFGLVAKF